MSIDSDAGSDKEEDQGKDPDLEAESKTGNQEGAGAGAEPPDKETGEAQEETPKEGQVEESQSMGEKLLEKKKPARNLLDSLRSRNAKGLEQDPSLLGPGATLYIKWSDSLRKENKSPWNTAWGYISLTEECFVSEPQKPVWNWIHPTDQNLTGHIKLEPNRAWEVVRGVVTKEQEESRIQRNKEPGHEYNTLKTPTMTKVPLKVQAHQPEPVADETEEFLGHTEQYPGLFEDGTFENQKVVNITADSKNFEVEVSQPREQDVISVHPTASTAGLSIHSSVMENYLNGLSSEIKSHLFNVILSNVIITRPEVRELVGREMRGLKLIKSMTKATAENRKVSTVRKVWQMLQPVRLDFLETYNICATLCVDVDQTDEAEEDLGVLDMLNVFTDTSDLEGPLTGLDKLVMDLQASLVGQYGGIWTIGSNNQNSDLTTNQRVSKDAEKGQERPEVGEGGATGAVRRKFIPPPSVVSSSVVGQGDHRAPLATSGDKAANPSLDQDQMINHRLIDLARQKQEVERMKKDQEEHLRYERAEVERMRKKNEEQAEKMKRDQEEHMRLRQEIRKMKRVQEESLGWEREQVERVRIKNEEQVEGMRKKMEKMDQKEKEVKEAENKVSRDKAALREDRKAAEEQRKKDRKRLEQEKRRGEEKVEEQQDAANTDMEKKSKVKTSDSHHNPETAAGTGKDDSEDDDEDRRKPQEKEKIKKSGRKRENSITSWSSNKRSGTSEERVHANGEKIV